MNLKTILILVVVAYLGLSAVQIGTPWIRNQMLVNDMDSEARALVYGSVAAARERMLEAARSNRVPLGEGDLTVERDEATRRLVISARYSVTVTTPFGLYTHTWDFSPRVEMPLPEGGGPPL